MLRFPFYAWIRAGVLLYLVLPQTQGARIIYQTHIDPFLSKHESEIDTFISSAHDRAKAAGLQYLKRALEFVKVNILGLAPKKPSPPQSVPSGTSYAQSLLARFYLPAARKDTPPSPANDLYNLISAVLGQSRSSSSSSDALSPAQSAMPDLPTKDDRISYIVTQSERLRAVLHALDKEASRLLHPTPLNPTDDDDDDKPNVPVSVPVTVAGEGGPSMRKNKSETDFESVSRDDVGDSEGEEGQEEKRTATATATATTAGWMPWTWRKTNINSPPTSPPRAEKKDL